MMGPFTVLLVRALRVLMILGIFALLASGCLAVDPPGALRHSSSNAGGGSGSDQAGTSGGSTSTAGAGGDRGGSQPGTSGGSAGIMSEAGSPDESGETGGGLGAAVGGASDGGAGGDQCLGCAFGCSNGACDPDPCDSVTCNTQQPPQCSGNKLNTFDAIGTCSAGQCNYQSTTTACDFGCANGACEPDPCIGMPCNSAPPGKCLSASTYQTYDPTGTCRAGMCTYSPRSVTCTCTGNACSTDPCANAPPCVTPNAPTCKDANTKRTFAATGTCSGGSCSYAPTDMACPFGCASGACKADPCANKPCTTQTPAVCKDASTLTTYASTGTCSAGQCTYNATNKTCQFGCANAACKADPCIGVTCTKASTCSNSMLTTYTSGTCSAGSCSYKMTTSACAFGCGSNGACKADPCANVSCTTQMPAFCKDASTLTTYASTGTCSAGTCTYSTTNKTCSFGCANAACKADPCASVTCNNGATCSGGACNCTSRFNGTHCEYQIFRGIGVLSGDATSDAISISRDGTIVVGASYPSAGSPTHAVRSVNGGALLLMNEISGLTPDRGCQPTAVDSAGNVLGNCEYTPFLCSSSSDQAQAFITPPTDSQGMYVADISASNKAVAGYYVNSDNGYTAFLWTSLGITVIPQAAVPSAISSDGTIVVGENWRYSSATNLTTPLKGIGNEGAEASDISANNKVIVGNIANDCVKWTGTSFVTITDLGAGQCIATNADGSAIVGNDGNNAAALWDSAGVQRSIADMVVNSPDLSGWTLGAANGVSDDGKFVVGGGFNGNKQRDEGWVVHLP